MTIAYTDVNDTLRRVALTGRLDIAGTDAIALQFTALTAAAHQRAVVDLSAVDFLASIGIRAIVANARAMQARGSRMVLFVGDNAPVAKTLSTTGIDAVIPMFSDLAQADEAALA
ncbi:STAS domain-containing protein [Duganella sp. FT80W]|uniref:STAS domain-containing protein n=1 Tax=Duganella guangzhouensis TaxID=2666084 RepID=A0A6I2L7V9_9BURK|nr:STAS domain-containing protein [Duganella guangzhouensis]MRW93933.1 STAS domain-containing protein [Duganella guangzhouensis]